MKDLCIRCNKPTPYDQSTPITVRRYFVEGSGQLCPECYRAVYGAPTVTIEDHSKKSNPTIRDNF